MRLVIFKVIAVAIFISLFLNACQKSEYARKLEAGLSSGERYDSLFLNLHFGTEVKDFFDICWQMNKEGLVIQGPSNLSVEYKLDSGELKHQAIMRFYPEFHNSKIYQMPINFLYKGWAPWTKHLAVDSLELDVKNLMERWYGPGFVLAENDDKSQKLWVKVDGNRRIRIFKKSIKEVRVDITDMTILDEALEAKAKKKKERDQKNNS
ncbi:MAG: hypothetical protein AAF039_12500 [Bacteroidota bacterium]